MHSFYKKIAYASVIVAPIVVSILVLLFSNSMLTHIIASIYLVILCGLFLAGIVKNYKSILLKLGLWPISQPVIPPPHTQ